MPPELVAAGRPRDAAWAALAGLASFALYLASLCPTVSWADSAELTAAAFHLGIPHPPGYPLYVTLAHSFTWLPLDPGRAVNLFSAVASAAAVALCAQLARELGARPAAALAAAGVYATGPVVWSNAVVAEVYGPGVAFAAASWLLVVRGVRRGDRRWVWAGAGVAGLGLGVHLFLATTGLGLLALVLGGRRGAAPRERAAVAAGAGLCVVAGASCFLLLPARADAPTPLTWGDPSSLGGLWYIVRGGEFRHWRFAGGVPADQWSAMGLSLLRGSALVGLPLALGGLASLARREPRLALAVALGVAGNLWFFHDYRVPDIEVFLLPGLLLLCAALALGVDVLARAAEARGGARLRNLVLAAALALSPAAAAAGWRGADRSGDTSALDWGEAVCEQLPPDARFAYFTSSAEWRRYTVFHLYQQLVRGCRPDVAVLTAPSPRRVESALAAGHPVYLFAPVPAVAARFAVSREGGLLRVRELVRAGDAAS